MAQVETTVKETPEKIIDVKKVVASKSETLAKWMPGFILNFLKRLLREKEVNETVKRVKHLEGLEFVDGALKDIDVTVNTIGLENIPEKGGVIIAANHPLGGIDGMAFMKAVGEVRSDIQFLVNDMLFMFEGMQSLFVPVNKVGQNPREATKLIEEAYAKEIALLVFPSGLVSRKLPGGIQDLDWKRSFILKAVRNKKNIVPAHISGQNSKRFYRFSKLRQLLGIKRNLEMGLLADEMYRQRGSTITVRFGKAVPYQQFDNSKSPAEWAAYMRQKTYDLPKEK
ncbi:MAG: 1-acyl-sn-glycerol-3-phosphate acyltransferase [Owenweeksia sp.]|nr:1-acyl-sn-glycerol-3-phosphate acyltransferase [Owenweeksia sp.]